MTLALARKATVSAALLAVIAAGCVDRGMIIVVENQNDAHLLARATGGSFGETLTPYVAVLNLPPRTRLVVARNAFRGGVQVNQIEILTPDCKPIATLTNFERDGGLVLIEQGPTVQIRHEFPTEGEDASPSDQCLVPAPSP